MATFGQQLRTLRERQGLTRRELEDRTGISQRQIEYLEKDQKDPRRGTLETLAQELGAEILEAAFPNLVVLRSRGRKTAPGKSSTARESSFADWPIPVSPAQATRALTPALALG